MRTTFAALSLTACCLAFGCQRNSSNTSYNAIKTNQTPELRGTAERPVDTDRHVWATMNMNMRSAWDDAGRVWLMDRPGLSAMPVYSSSGVPR